MENKTKKLDRHFKNELVKRGFKKKYLSDRSGYWYEKKYNKNPYKLKLLVDECFVDLQIECDSIDYGEKKKIFETLRILKFTKSNFIKIMNKYELE